MEFNFNSLVICMTYASSLHYCPANLASVWKADIWRFNVDDSYVRKSSGAIQSTCILTLGINSPQRHGSDG